MVSTVTECQARPRNLVNILMQGWSNFCGLYFEVYTAWRATDAQCDGTISWVHLVEVLTEQPHLYLAWNLNDICASHTHTHSSKVYNYYTCSKMTHSHLCQSVPTARKPEGQRIFFWGPDLPPGPHFGYPWFKVIKILFNLCNLLTINAIWLLSS